MPNNFFNAEELLEQGVSNVKKQVTTQVNATGNAIGNQFTGTQTAASAEDLSSQAQSTQNSQNSDQSANDFIKDLYGSSEKNIQAQSANTQGANQAITLQGKNINQPKTQEEAERLAKARKDLLEQHMVTYYKPTFEAPPQQEEKTAEKLDREKEEEETKKMQELQEEKKKEEVPLAVRMSSQKAEKFRGASG